MFEDEERLGAFLGQSAPIRYRWQEDQNEIDALQRREDRLALLEEPERIGAISRPRQYAEPPALSQEPKPVLTPTGTGDDFAHQPEVTDEDRTAGRVESFVGNIATGFAGGIAAIPKAIGEVARLADAGISDVFGGTPQEKAQILSKKNAFDKLGDAINEFTADITDINPAYQEETTQQLGHLLGFAGSALLGGPAAKILKMPKYLLPAAMGSALFGVQQVEDYKNMVRMQGGIVNATDETNAFGLGAALGVVPGVLVTRSLGRLNNLTGGYVVKALTPLAKSTPGKVVGEMLAGGLEGASAFAAITVGSNLIANSIVNYDPERGTFEGVADAGKLGFLFSGTLNTITASIGARGQGKFEQAVSRNKIKEDLEGLGGSQELINKLVRDTKGNPLNPESSSEYRSKDIRDLLSSYVNLYKFRAAQESGGKDIGPVDARIAGKIRELEGILYPEEEIGKDASVLDAGQAPQRKPLTGTIRLDEAMDTYRWMQRSESTRATLAQFKDYDNTKAPEEQYEVKEIDYESLPADKKAQIDALEANIGESVKDKVEPKALDEIKSAARRKPTVEGSEPIPEKKSTARGMALFRSHIEEKGYSLERIMDGEADMADVAKASGVRSTMTRLLELQWRRNQVVKAIQEDPSIPDADKSSIVNALFHREGSVKDPTPVPETLREEFEKLTDGKDAASLRKIDVSVEAMQKLARQSRIDELVKASDSEAANSLAARPLPIPKYEAQEPAPKPKRATRNKTVRERAQEARGEDPNLVPVTSVPEGLAGVRFPSVERAQMEIEKLPEERRAGLKIETNEDGTVEFKPEMKRVEPDEPVVPDADPVSGYVAGLEVLPRPEIEIDPMLQRKIETDLDARDRGDPVKDYPGGEKALDVANRSIPEPSDIPNSPLGGTESITIARAMGKINAQARQGALVAVDSLREALKNDFQDKESFDRAILEMAEKGYIQAQTHAFPGRLSEEAKQGLIANGRGGFLDTVGFRTEGKGWSGLHPDLVRELNKPPEKPLDKDQQRVAQRELEHREMEQVLSEQVINEAKIDELNDLAGRSGENVEARRAQLDREASELAARRNEIEEAKRDIPPPLDLAEGFEPVIDDLIAQGKSQGLIYSLDPKKTSLVAKIRALGDIDGKVLGPNKAYFRALSDIYREFLRDRHTLRAETPKEDLEVYERQLHEDYDGMLNFLQAKTDTLVEPLSAHNPEMAKFYAANMRRAIDAFRRQEMPETLQANKDYEARRGLTDEDSLAISGIGKEQQKLTREWELLQQMHGRKDQDGNVFDAQPRARAIEQRLTQLERAGDELGKGVKLLMPKAERVTERVTVDRKTGATIHDTEGFLGPKPQGQFALPSNGNLRLSGPLRVNFPSMEKLQPTIRQLEAFVNRLNPILRGKLDIRIVTDATTLDRSLDRHLVRLIEQRGGLVPGYFVPAEFSPTGKATAYILVQSAGPNSIKTLMHEVVGHFGLHELFPKDLDSFLTRVYTSNPQLASVIHDYTARWKEVRARDPEFKSGKFTFKKSLGEEVAISHDAMRGLTEEYIADLAKRFTDPVFRSRMAPKQMNLLQRVFAMLKHFMRKIGFGKEAETITDHDLALIVSESYSRIFQDPALSAKLQNNWSVERRLRELGVHPEPGRFEIKDPIPYSLTKTQKEMDAIFNANGEKHKVFGKDTLDTAKPEERERMIDYLDEPEELAESLGGFNQEDIRRQARLLESGYGDVNRNALQAWMHKIGRKIKEIPGYHAFDPLGKLTHKEMYLDVQAKAFGDLAEKAERYPLHINKIFGKLNDVQADQLFEYFSTKGMDVEILTSLPKNVRDVAKEAKLNIYKLGEELVKLGYLTQDKFLENADSYVPAVYLEYFTSENRGGHRLSFMSYLQQKLPPEARGVLESTRIKDPSVLIPHTISVIQRDLAVINFMNSLRTVSKAMGSDWVLGEENIFKLRGRDWSITEAKKHLTIRKAELAQSQTMRPQDIEYLTGEIAEFEEAIARQETLAQSALMAKAQEHGFTTVKEYTDANYKHVDDKKIYGPLRDLWIRKEIYHDMVEPFQMFNPKYQDQTVEKWFGPNGYLVNINQHWKGIHVLLNAGSWPRNGIGNHVLLDISTDRNSVTLTKWVVEAAKNYMDHALDGKELDRYWKMAIERGIRYTTYSGTEINHMRTKYVDFQKSLGEPEQQGLFARMLPQLTKPYLTAMDAAGQAYGLLEAVFKVVRMRDHVERWEEQNKISIDSLGKVERDVVLARAFAEAQDATFDYSKVINFVRMMRKYPLGSPFLTFAVKSLPASIRGLALHPQKFIKYAMLPTVAWAAWRIANPDLDEKDYEQLIHDLPLHTREQHMPLVLPLKDGNGRWQYMPLGYYLPWATHLEAMFRFKEQTDTSSMPGMLFSTAANIDNVVTHKYGFLGGPIPSMVSALTVQRDGFTGRDIMTPGAAPERRFNEMSHYLWGMAAPTWLTNRGFLGKLSDDLGVSVLPGARVKEFDRFGKDRMTSLQVASTLVGANITPINAQEERANRMAKFTSEINEVKKQRTKLLRERMPEATKASELKSLNARIKLLNEKRAEALG